MEETDGERAAVKEREREMYKGMSIDREKIINEKLAAASTVGTFYK